MPSSFGWNLSSNSASAAVSAAAVSAQSTLCGIKTSGGAPVYENHNLVLISGAEYALQKVKARLHFFLGTWFLDTREGVPYYRDILIKNPNLNVARSLFRSVIQSVPGVLVRTIDVSVDTNRVMSVGFNAVYVPTNTEIGAKVRPFLLEDY
jgi:hypothetical protein